MKKTILFLLFSIIISTVHAQEVGYFYAIDGSKWATAKARDRQEDSLHKELLDYIEKMDKNGHFKGEEKKALKEKIIESINVEKDFIKTIREINNYIPESLYPILEARGITTKSRSSTGEVFMYEELKDVFELIVDSFKYKYNLCKSLSAISPKDGSLDDISETLTNKLDEIFQAFNIKNEKSLATLKIIQDIYSSEKENIENKAVDEVFYAIDGSSYFNQQQRDKYEMSLFDDILDKIKDNPKMFVNKEELDDIYRLAELISRSPNVIRILDIVFIDKGLTSKKDKIFPAYNNEVFSNIDIRDCFNYLISIHEILDKMADDVAIYNEKVVYLDLLKTQDHNGDTFYDLYQTFNKKYSYLVKKADIE